MVNKLSVNEIIKKYWELVKDIDTPNKMGELLGRILAHMFNTYSSASVAKHCAEYVINYVHHTTQQSIMRGIICYLKIMGENEYTDARNIRSVEAARIAYQALKEQGYTDLPMV